MKGSSGSKRKASLAVGSSKRPAIEKSGTPAHNGAKGTGENDVFLYQFYPPEMTNARAMQYNRNELKRPIEELHDAVNDTHEDRDNIKTKSAVIHWLKCDLRLHDNTALHLAAERARESDVPLICTYIVSPQDFQAHLTSPARMDFIIRTLEILKKDLEELDIPLYVETVTKRREIPDRILGLANEWGASHIYANIEYEVDELRREASMTRKAAEKGIVFIAVSDTCVVEPGRLSAKTSGNQYAVYTPWYRAWMAYIHEHPEALVLHPPPGKNPRSAREKFKYLFEQGVPDVIGNKRLGDEEKKRLRSLWPAGEHEARKRLEEFIREGIGGYEAMRNTPSASGTSMLSAYFAAGTLSARTAIRRAQDTNGGSRLDTGNKGIMTWISEVAWRDFYKHVLAHWPHIWYADPF